MACLSHKAYYTNGFGPCRECGMSVADHTRDNKIRNEGADLKYQTLEKRITKLEEDIKNFKNELFWRK